jgi:hypothetical protein
MAIANAFSLIFDHAAGALWCPPAIHLGKEDVRQPAMEIDPPR